MLIAVDIDNTVLQFDKRWRDLYRTWFDSDPAPPDDWNAPFQSDMLEDEAAFYTWFEKAGGWDDMEWVPGAPWGIEALLSQGHHVRFVTARTGVGAIAARDWIRTTTWREDQLFTDASVKTRILSNLYIDDSPHVAADVLAAGKPILLVDQPWNSELEESALLTRCTSWPKIVDEVGRIGAGRPKAGAQRATATTKKAAAK